MHLSYPMVSAKCMKMAANYFGNQALLSMYMFLYSCHPYLLSSRHITNRSHGDLHFRNLCAMASTLTLLGQPHLDTQGLYVQLA